MQDNPSEETSTPAGLPLEKLAEALGSRRMLLGSLFGAVAGSFAAAQPAMAAPGEVIGSSNIPMKVYTNTKGTYVLWADGSITNARDDSAAASNPDSYPVTTRFARHRQTAGRSKGSPRVAVDIVQDEQGSYILFADGTFRQPPVGGPGAPGFGIVEYFYAKTYHGTVPSHSNNLIVSGNNIQFKTPFREAPFYFVYFNPGDAIIFPGIPGHNQPTTTSWDISTFNQSNMEGGFFGFGTH